MIIQGVKKDKGFLFFRKPSLKLITNQGESALSFFEVSSEDLDQKLHGLEIAAAADFSSLTMRFSHPELIRQVQLAVFNSQFQPQEFFSKGIKQLPRPMHTVLEKKNGIQFFVLSLNALSFEKAALANEEIITFLRRKIKEPDSLSEEQILEIIKEAIREAHLHHDFELRIGMNFSNALPLEKVREFIQKYNLLYVEQPSASLEECKQLTEEFKTNAFITRPVYNEQEAKELNINAALLSFLPIEQLSSLVTVLKEKKVNLFYALKEGEEALAVALAFPVVKVSSKEKNSLKTFSSLKEKIKNI